MKKILLSLSVLAFFSADAQLKEGKVIYERTMQLRVNANSEVAHLVPPQRTDNFELQFGNNQSIWRVIPNAEGDNSTVSGPGFMMRMAGNDDVIYYNFEKAQRIDQRDLFDREFLVEDSISKLKWKLKEENKSILNFNATKAVAERIGSRSVMTMENGEMKRQQVADTSYITAWFTSEVPVPAGPSEFQGQLPGLILELNVNNGRTVYKAVEVSPKVNVASIKEPKGGKRLTAQEFNKERDKLMEEMRKNNPGGNRSIRIVQ
ncbi:MAG: GLPGLI family protein [Bacteroidota bacterium]|nr:GLPGLI family protein [Bacteroidota bacterium]